MALLPTKDTVPFWPTWTDFEAVMVGGAAFVTVMAIFALAVRLSFVSRSNRLSVSVPV